MGEYLNIVWTGSRPEVPEGQVATEGKNSKYPLHANLTETATVSLENALANAGLSKSAFLESVALHAADLLQGTQETNSLLATARAVSRERIERGQANRRASRRANNGST